MVKGVAWTHWKCEKGHVYESPVPVTAVRCGECAKSVTVKSKAWMKPVFPQP
jgi:hypothetical protein